MSKYTGLTFFRLKGTDKIAGKVVKQVPNLNFELLHRIENVQPTFLMTDVDLERRTCDRAIIVGPQSEIEDAFLGVFRSSFIPKYQINLIMTLTELLDDLEIAKVE